MAVDNSRPRLSPSLRGGTVVVVLLLSACVPHQVERVFDGEPASGRYISARSYALFARAVEAEAREQLGVARRYLRAVAETDSASVEAWTRLGAVSCRMGRADEATRAFSRAEALDERYEPLWRERAKCALATGRFRPALSAARRAFQADPQRDETVLLLVHVLQINGLNGEAKRLLEELAIRSPASLPVWTALREHAREQDDPSWERFAQQRLDLLKSRMGNSPPVRSASPRATPSADAVSSGRLALQKALRRGDLAIARRLSRKAHFEPHVLAAEAIVVGQPRLALKDAQLRLDADPADSDARIAVALAADLLGDSAASSATMAALPDAPDGVSELGRIMMAELLQRHGSRAAARAWLQEVVTLPRRLPQDLTQQLLERVAPP